MAEALLTALKPEKFCVSKKGDPDILLTEFNEYVKTFERFTKACNLDQGHVPGEDGEHVGCATCGRLVAMFECVRQDKIQVLLEHVGKVEEGDSWNTTKTKVKFLTPVGTSMQKQNFSRRGTLKHLGINISHKF